MHRWVTQDIRYVAVELGIGGYQPRPAAEVLRSGFGDCKDKTTLFIALLEGLGVRAYPVLLYAGSYRQGGEPPPALEAFNHAIAAVAGPEGYRYTDLTAELTPFGELPPEDQGRSPWWCIPRAGGSRCGCRSPRLGPTGWSPWCAAR